MRGPASAAVTNVDARCQPYPSYLHLHSSYAGRIKAIKRKWLFVRDGHQQFPLAEARDNTRERFGLLGSAGREPPIRDYRYVGGKEGAS
jgi:hypothetical protein